jgi:hypothetical protein
MALRQRLSIKLLPPASAISIQSDPIDQLAISVVCCPVGCRCFRSFRIGTSASPDCAAQLRQREGGLWGGVGTNLIFISFRSFGMTAGHSDQHLYIYIYAVSQAIRSGAQDRDAEGQDSGRLEGSN